ncbi:MAG: phosphoribosylamine--glycine ligase [Parcubacteria group bacterium Gr01-1014_66]|nr:MAG: phosphoribosylamine--glycine ligase [Parcubacteria group bacterium Gr01-1014_66]
MTHNGQDGITGFGANGKINGSSIVAQKEPLKFLFISWETLSGDLAWRLAQEGYEVKFWSKNPDDADIYEGFIEKIAKWEEFKDWADIIIFDDSGFGKIADSLRKAEKYVIGGTEYTDRLEEDREFGQGEMRRVGMNVLPHWDFSDFESAIQFIHENPGRYVFKPSGTILSGQKGTLFIGQDESGSDLLEVLMHNKKTWENKIKRFQLQKFVAGVEIAVGAFFNGKDFMYPINVNFEHKKLFPGDIGPYTGEMGTLMYWSESNKVFRMTLEKMREPLIETGYIGYIDINCIANGYTVYPLEFTARFGYPTLSIQLEGILTSPGEWIGKLARGEACELRTKKGFQVGVVVAVPPFPYNDRRAFEVYKDLSIVFKKPNLEGVHLGAVKLVEGDWHLTGGSGYALVVTGSGSTVAEARKMAYNRIDNIILQNKYYRTDIGIKWSTESDKLQSWGYLY